MRPMLQKDALTVIKITSIVSLNVVLWSYSTWLVTNIRWMPLPECGDLATLLFGASSIALFIFSILMALVALIGWSEIQSRLKRVDNLENQLNGRVLSTLGHLLGEMSVDRETFDVKDKERERLDEAITHCQNAYEILQGHGEKLEFMALNNLIYCLSLANESGRSDFLLEEARRTNKVAQKHRSNNLILTSSRAILQLSSDKEEKSRVRTSLRSIQESSLATSSQKREATVYLERFQEVD